MNRLAAAHRGTLRVLQFAVNQLSDPSHAKVPPYYKELGKLIRMLSLCSAKVEAERNLETADILQKLEVRSMKCKSEDLDHNIDFHCFFWHHSSTVHCTM